MAKIYVPKNISDNGSLLVHERPNVIAMRIEEAKKRGNEFITLVVENGTKDGKELTIKASLVQAYE